MPKKHSLTVRFEGGDATHQQMNMYHFGNALVGLEQLVSVGKFVADNGRLPKGRERLPFTVNVSAPRAGSIEVLAFLQSGAAFVPLLHEAYFTGSAKLLWNWISGALFKLGGDDERASDHMLEMIKTNNAMNEGNAAIEQRRLDVEERRLDVEERRLDIEEKRIAADDRRDKRRSRELMTALESRRLILPARNLVRPIGESCECLTLNSGDEQTVIDSVLAEKIRAATSTNTGLRGSFVIDVDGFSHHNQQIKFTLPDNPNRYITGYIHDSKFDVVPNVYTEAATAKSKLVVVARPVTNRNGELLNLQIQSAKKYEEHAQ